MIFYFLLILFFELNTIHASPQKLVITSNIEENVIKNVIGEYEEYEYDSIPVFQISTKSSKTPKFLYQSAHGIWSITSSEENIKKNKGTIVCMTTTQHPSLCENWKYFLQGKWIQMTSIEFSINKISLLSSPTSSLINNDNKTVENNEICKNGNMNNNISLFKQYSIFGIILIFTFIFGIFYGQKTKYKHLSDQLENTHKQLEDIKMSKESPKPPVISSSSSSSSQTIPLINDISIPIPIPNSPKTMPKGSISIDQEEPGETSSQETTSTTTTTPSSSSSSSSSSSAAAAAAESEGMGSYLRRRVGLAKEHFDIRALKAIVRGEDVDTQTSDGANLKGTSTFRLHARLNPNDATIFESGLALSLLFENRSIDLIADSRAHRDFLLFGFQRLANMGPSGGHMLKYSVAKNMNLNIEFVNNEQGCLIVASLPQDGDAYKLGLQKNDLILSADNTSMRFMSPIQANDFLVKRKMNKSSSFTLTIERAVTQSEAEMKRRAIAQEKETMALLSSVGLSSFETKILNFGISTLQQLANKEVVTDEVLLSPEIGMKPAQIKKLRRALQKV